MSGADISADKDKSRLVLVLQQKYKTSSLFDVRLPITFSKGGTPGVDLSAIEEAGSVSLDDAKDPIHLGERDKITHRMLIAGWHQQYYVFERQVAARRFNANRDPHSRMTIARHIARSVRQWMESSEGEWVLSNADTVRFEDLILMRMDNVSEGSWQIVLGYKRPNWVDTRPL